MIAWSTTQKDRQMSPIDRDRYTVHFTNETPAGYESWTEDYESLADARETAESVVTDGDAQRAEITARYAATDETYTRNGWTCFDAD